MKPDGEMTARDELIVRDELIERDELVVRDELIKCRCRALGTVRAWAYATVSHEKQCSARLEITEARSISPAVGVIFCFEGAAVLWQTAKLAKQLNWPNG